MNNNLKWYFVHFLAVSSCLLIAYMLLQNILYAPDMAGYNPNTFEITIVMLNFPSVFILWGWMISDFFKHSTNSKPVLWGCFLVFGNVLAALIYFYTQWRPRFASNT